MNPHSISVGMHSAQGTRTQAVAWCGCGRDDYACMAQRDASGHRSASDEAEFQCMLAAIADLYLTSHVLILLDNTYMARFWTLMEAWCAMMTATSGGVRASTEAERRYTITCIHEADPDFSRPMLVKKLSTKSPAEVATMLASPDVAVTNKKDKETMLPIVAKTDEHVRHVLLSA